MRPDQLPSVVQVSGMTSDTRNDLCRVTNHNKNIANLAKASRMGMPSEFILAGDR